MHHLMREFEDCPIITAIKSDDGLEKCLSSDSSIVFVLYGNICTIPAMVERIENAGKHAIVHLDLVEGLAPKEIAVDYVKQYTRASGVISTKASLIRRAKELGLFTVLRIFVLDSIALKNVEKEWRNVRPDLIEILPGVMPKIIRKLSRSLSVPLIAGGMIQDKDDVMAALDAGALGVSSTDQAVWFL